LPVQSTQPHVATLHHPVDGFFATQPSERESAAERPIRVGNVEVVHLVDVARPTCYSKLHFELNSRLLPCLRLKSRHGQAQLLHRFHLLNALNDCAIVSNRPT
jgi:hypothetical protein